MNPIPLPYRILAIIGLFCVGLGLGFYAKSVIDENEQLKHEAQIKDVTEQLNKALTLTRVEYITKIQTVRVKGDTIIEKVPMWVDGSIAVNKGFIVHHNVAAVNGVLPSVLPLDVMQPSTVPLTEVEATIAENYKRYNECRQQVSSLIDSINVYKSKIPEVKP